MAAGIAIGLIFAALYGSQMIAFKKTLEENRPSVCFLYYTIFGLVIWLPFALWSGIRFEDIGPILAVTFISALLSEAYVTYGISKGRISIASALFSTFPAATILFAYILLGERLTGGELLAVLGTVAGIILISLPQKIADFRSVDLAGLLFPLSAAAAAGFSDVISKGVLDRSSVPTFMFGLALGQIPAALIYYRIDSGGYAFWKSLSFGFRSQKALIYAACCNAMLLVLFWTAYYKLYASIAAPVTGTYVLFVALLARVFLNEKLHAKDYWGIAVIVASVFCLGL